MTIITTRNKAGTVIDIACAKIEKDGRIYMIPQMIDITDTTSPQEIYDLIMEHERKVLRNILKENEGPRKIRERAEKAWLDKWNS